MNIIGNIKTYQWGKLGSSSKVAQLAKLNSSAFNVDPNESYAELWMGDHPSGPSTIAHTNESLTTYLSNNKNVIGEMDKLPFLLKVLSIGKALSVQVHPNKKEAEILFNTRPDLYKDPNHKPELAIALTPFLALCGFRPHEEIYTLLKKHLPLTNLIGAANIENLHTNGAIGLKECFSALMHANQEAINQCIQELTTEFQQNDNVFSTTFNTLNHDFPNDVGILCLFFLNIVELQPGQAIFLPAQVPHAYLSGDCIECMACSDNVVRAGLTPKFKDVETLLAMLNYTGASANDQLFQPYTMDKWRQVFAPKVDDFAIVKIQIPAAEKNCTIENSKYGSILIVLSGKAQLQATSSITLETGKIVFLPATSTTFSLELNNTESDFVAYQAMFNDFKL